MLAPIALYPDPLLSQVLMAATYPARSGRGGALVARQPRPAGRRRGARGAERGLGSEREVAGRVPAAAAAHGREPRLDAQRSATPSSRRNRRSWTRCSSCGAARRPRATCNRASRCYVQQQGPTIVVQPAAPQYVYVPYYDPMVVYGPWWWPAYRPVVLGAVAGYAALPRRRRFWWGRRSAVAQLLLRRLRLAPAPRARGARQQLLLPPAGAS